MQYPEFPLKTFLLCGDEGIVDALARVAFTAGTFGDDIVPGRVDGGVRLLARDEAALRAGVDLMAFRFADRLQVVGPIVRCVYGASVLEPFMRVLARGPALAMREVQRELEGRGGVLASIDYGVGWTRLDGQAPLKRLIGFEQWMTPRRRPGMSLRYELSHYGPADALEPPPGASPPAHGMPAAGGVTPGCAA